VKIGDVVECTITGIQPYGLFARFGKDLTGLIHVSEVQSGYTKNMEEMFSIGDKVTAKVIDIDGYSKKVSLSIRALETTTKKVVNKRKRYFSNKYKQIGFQSVGDSMDRWIREALENLAGENKHAED
jgi:general stress protein 13